LPLDENAGIPGCWQTTVPDAKKRQPLIVVARLVLINLYVFEPEAAILLANEAKSGQFDGSAAFFAVDEVFDGFDV
jgi:hypothetical protein